MAKSGTVPLRIEATAESILCSPHEISRKGSAVLVTPKSASNP